MNTFKDTPAPSGTYPAHFPLSYAGKDDAILRAYRKGWNAGHGIACHNVPTLGARIFSESLGRVTVDADNIREVHESACFEVEQNGRQFSPFEFTAQEFNQAGDGDEDTPGADELWEAYDEGVADAIRADLATYKDEDYGITEDSDEGED